MPNGWTPISLVKPYRIMIAGSGRSRYYDSSQEERQQVFLPRFGQMLEEWEELGARVVASFVNDVFRSGPPDPAVGGWYLIYEIDDLDTAARMIQASKQEVGGVAVWQWVKLDLYVGRPFFAREEHTPQRTIDTSGSSNPDAPSS